MKVHTNPATVIEKPKETPTPLRASQLRDGLMGTVKQRMEGDRSILIKMTSTARPEVVFTGFWNGKFIQSAFKSISRAYRESKARPSRR